jgi:hypothetical protein
MKEFLSSTFAVVKAFFQSIIVGALGCLVIPASIGLIYFLYTTIVGESKTFIIVEKTTFVEEKVKEDDLRFKEIWHTGEAFILNNSGKTIFLNEVRYGGSSSNKSYKVKASSNIQALIKDPDYIFREPPSSIRVRSGSSRTRWHLKR